MFGHAFADFERQIQAGKAGITLLELLDNAQRVNVVIEAVAETAHLPVQFLFTGVRERRMADVVNQGQRFGEIFIETQHRGERAGDLRNLDGMGEPVAEMIGKAGREDLRLGFQTPESACVNDAIAVALKGVAVRMAGFGIAAAQTALNPESKPFEHAERGYWPGISDTALMAAWLIGPACVRSGSSSLRASAGLVRAIPLANAMVACSFEMRAVG